MAYIVDRLIGARRPIGWSGSVLAQRRGMVENTGRSDHRNSRLWDLLVWPAAVAAVHLGSIAESSGESDGRLYHLNFGRLWWSRAFIAILAGFQGGLRTPARPQ